ncbi:lipoprotein [Desulfuromonas versatilis]|uniref:Lipoprotein n=1 Tax=Desulfuromonas versatilis TaxID=2802975 RepID=A0ABN6DY43_9BACT|nr:hypothetical protein [Desulfuromonas versatilis]BCR05015.1 lipoprotein [Desulfuromonas versatilis]
MPIMRLFFTAMALGMLLSGCGFAVVPKATATATVDPVAGSISETNKGVRVTARVQDLEIVPYHTLENLTSFLVTVENLTQGPLSIPLDSFLLIDQDGTQYRAVPPERVIEIAKKDSAYLIPYPYVGYYYLEDREKGTFFNTFDSALPYFAENYPQDIRTEGLPQQSIIPGAKVSGAVYFLAELGSLKSFEMRVYLPGADLAGPADFRLPFSIEKK